MLRRILVSVVSSAFFICAGACGPAAPKPAEPTVLPIGTSSKPDTGLAGAKTGTSSRRGASDALKRAWPIDQATFALYADLEGLMKTRLMGDLARALVLIAAPHMTAVERKCIEDGFAQTKELAVGSERGGSIIIARLDRPVAMAIGTCVSTLGDARPVTLTGATEAWKVRSNVAAVTPSGLFVYGSDAAVARAVAGGGSGLALAAVSLGESEYVAWSASILDDQKPARGTLLVTDDRFRISGEGDLPNEEVAKLLEKEAARSNLEAQLPQLGVPADQMEAVRRLITGIDVKRDGNHVAVSFELRGSPARQAADLGAAAAIAVTGVRKYISSAKQAEAKNTVAVLAKDVVTDWEREDGKPVTKKKLVSYPAVPKVVPKGMKYQSSTADWKPWAPLRFEMSAPQYYQYEIKAAKDGESAEIIARGDLNGDGKTSEFKITVKVDRATNALRVAPSIHEIDPDE